MAKFHFQIGDTLVYADPKEQAYDWLVFEVKGTFTNGVDCFYIDENQTFINQNHLITYAGYIKVLQELCNLETDIKKIAEFVIKGCTPTPEQRSEMLKALNNKSIAQAFCSQK